MKDSVTQLIICHSETHNTIAASLHSDEICLEVFLKKCKLRIDCIRAALGLLNIPFFHSDVENSISEQPLRGYSKFLISLFHREAKLYGHKWCSPTCNSSDSVTR